MKKEVLIAMIQKWERYCAKSEDRTIPADDDSALLFEERESGIKAGVEKCAHELRQLVDLLGE